MNANEITVAVMATERVSRELDEDYVGLWVLPWHIRRLWRDSTDEQVFELSNAILLALTAMGVIVGDLDGETGAFRWWPQKDVVSSVMAAWRVLGRDPNIGEIAWLARLD